jgi:branched-subunit amino acid transport protein AzlD
VFATVIFAGGSAATWMLRAAPFALLTPIRHSALLPYINENMPVGIMTILVFCTVRYVPRPSRR